MKNVRQTVNHAPLQSASRSVVQILRRRRAVSRPAPIISRDALVGSGTRLPRLDSPAAAPPAGAAKLWLFMDMREDLINWGNFMVNMTGYSPSNPTQYQFTSDLPGFYHNRSATFSFADGHGEIHKWLDSRTVPPLGFSGSSSIASPYNPDIAWLQDHSGRPK